MEKDTNPREAISNQFDKSKTKKRDERNSEVKYIEDDNIEDSRNPIPRHEQSLQEKGYAQDGESRRS